MHCPCQNGEGTEVILAYLGGRLDEETQKQVERHLEDCPSCQQVLLAEQVVFDALDDWRPPAVSADFDERLYRRIEAEERRVGWWWHLLRPALPFSLRPATVAAAACLFLFAGFLMRTPENTGLESAATSDPVDIDAVEQAVEDLEMLYLIDPVQHEEDGVEEVPAEDGAGMVFLALGKLRCG